MSLPKLNIGDVTVPTPIIQGGMGIGISLSGLASAVANEGGIGIIAGAMIGMKEPDIAKNPIEANVRALKQEIQKARELTSGLLGVNIMVALTTFTEMVKASIESRADFIFAGAGLPLELPKIFREVCEQKKEEFRTKLVPIVSSARAASIIAKKWLSRANYVPDAFVLEGPKAGGHLGYKAEDLEKTEFSLEKLLPELVNVAKSLEDKAGRAIPVIAGGGIFSGADIKNILDLGASGVQIGTRFAATHECDANIRFKEALVAAKKEDITIIKSPVGMPGRALDGAFIKNMRDGNQKPFKCAFHCLHTCEQEKTPYCIAMALISAMRGNLERGFAFCGSNAWKIDRIMSVRELMQTLQNEFDDAVRTMCNKKDKLLNT